MAIRFKCECGKALSAREIYAGRKVRCPKCGKKVTVPEPDEVGDKGEDGKGAVRGRGGLEAELLVGEDETIVFSSRPGVSVLVLRLIALNVLYVLVVVAPLVVAIVFWKNVHVLLSLPEDGWGQVLVLAPLGVGLVVGVVLNFLMWLTWQKTVYVLTASCIVAQGGVFFSSVQRMPLAKLGVVKQLRLGRGLAFFAS